MALAYYGGIYDAYEFAYGWPGSKAAPLQVIAGSTSTGAYTIVCAPTALQTTGGISIPINTKTPITIGSDSGIETVTPSAVSTNNLGQILITATFTNAHGTGAQVRSGDWGLQEAAQAATNKGGGLVALSRAFLAAAGLTTDASVTTFMLNYNSLSANVTILNYGGLHGAHSYTNATPGSAYAVQSTVLY